MLSKVATDLDYIKVQDYIQYKNINISSEKPSLSFSMAAQNKMERSFSVLIKIKLHSNAIALMKESAFLLWD